jgi:Tat protein translocase TatC
MLKTVFSKLFKMREHASRSRPGADDGFDAHEKPFLDHLEDLRHTLMKICGTLAVSTIACFTFHKQIFELVQVPAKMKLAEISPGVSLWDKLELITLGPTEFIVLMLKLSFYSGLIITFPFTIYFLFQFLLPGLRQAEKRAVIPGAGIGFILFLIGASFAFFGAAPIALKYFYVFENSRIANLDPAQQALEKPIGDFALVGFDGERIPPVGAEVEPPAVPEAAVPEAAVPEAAVPEAAVPEAAVPEAAVPEAAVPEAAVPEAAVPEAAVPAVPDPGATEPTPATSLSPALQAEIRQYIMNTLTTADGANFALRYDKDRDKLVLVAAKGGQSTYQIGKYIGFITQLVLVFGISFQMPIVVTILVKLQLLTARVMRETRTYAWIIILVTAGIVTPPDVLTLALLGGPLIFLYELCIVIATIMEKTRARKERAEEDSRRTRLEKLYSKPSTDLSEEEKAEMHRAEIEQYEREHANLYLEDSDHVSRDSLHGDGHGDGHDDPDGHGSHDGTQHDESWHADDHYWHDSHDSHAPHAGMESDHAEPEDLKPEDADAPDAGDEESNEPEHRNSEDHESCIPDGPVVDLNHATIEELITLPGIGPKTAQIIIENRRYETFDDLDRVPGLGPEKIRRITDRIMLG